ncbi:MAG: FAD-dependent oxidoreductase, partial [Pseudomonadota bacterium]
MIIDLLDLPARTEISADVVIVGGGMAGITLAREWAGREKTVAILESGGREADDASQELYAGTGTLSGEGDDKRNIDDYLITSRARFYGGSGHWWGGKSVPLDPADFATRPWIKHSGWPMSRADLQPYYDRACDV